MVGGGVMAAGTQVTLSSNDGPHAKVVLPRGSRDGSTTVGACSRDDALADDLASSRTGAPPGRCWAMAVLEAGSLWATPAVFNAGEEWSFPVHAPHFVVPTLVVPTTRVSGSPAPSTVPSGTGLWAVPRRAVQSATDACQRSTAWPPSPSQPGHAVSGQPGSRCPMACWRTKGGERVMLDGVGVLPGDPAAGRGPRRATCGAPSGTAR
jgi:hypothetical protein